MKTAFLVLTTCLTGFTTLNSEVRSKVKHEMDAEAADTMPTPAIPRMRPERNPVAANPGCSATFSSGNS